MDLLQYIGSIGGIGAVLAYVFFLAYKRVSQQMREDRKYAEDRLTGLLKAYNNSIRKHTKVLTELITWLKAKNGSR